MGESTLKPRQRRMWIKFSLLFGALLSGAYGLVCPFGWTPVGGLCLRSLGFQSFFNSNSICRQLGGRLFEPRTQELSNLLAEFLFGANTAWLGINDNRYVSDNQIIDYSQPSYSYDLAYMNSAGTWQSTTTSTTLRRAICELPRTNTECATISTIFVEDSFASSTNIACMDACKSTVGCKFWTFGLGQCGLRFYEAGEVVGGGVPPFSSTGFPYTVVAGGGRVLVGKALKDVETAKDCQTLCSEDPKCNSFTWTNIDFNFGGVNTETCIFNYGKTLRKLPIPLFPGGFQVVTGPPCCNAKKACEKADDSVSLTLTSSEGTSASSGSSSFLLPEGEKEVVISEKEFARYKVEFEKLVKDLTASSSSSSS